MGLFALLAAIVVFVFLVLPLATWSRVRVLAERVKQLEDEVRRLRGDAPPPAASPALAPPVPVRAAAPVRPAPASTPADLDRMEQLVGGVWLQNAGAVLLLLGVFLMILWGYGTGRFGPVVLVAAGAGLGLAFAWRGDRVARRLPAFGHALIGTGLGIVYIALELGFVRLHVLSAPVALALLALVSFLSVAAGLHYRVQLIAALGVIGAFLPQFMAAWLGLGGFHLSPWMLFGYLAVVDVVVFALAARAGWSGLDLAALVLGALAWLTSFHAGEWGWGVQAALAGLHTLLGFAPLPALVRAEGRVRAIDLMVIAAAPLALLAASARFLVWAAPPTVAMLLFALAAAWLLAALWTDSRRPERDLWAPLTGAAALFFTAALERALSPDVTPLAWCGEGLLLIALGLRPRADSLRLFGYVVLLTGGAWAFARLAFSPWDPGMMPGLYPAGLRALAAIAMLAIAGAVLAHGRARLRPVEALAPEFVTIAANLALMLWSRREAEHVARVIVRERGVASLDTLAASLTSAAWLLQAFGLLLAGWLRGSSFLRWTALALLGITVVKFVLVDLATVDVFWRFLTAIAVGAALLALSYAYQRRARKEDPA